MNTVKNLLNKSLAVKVIFFSISGMVIIMASVLIFQNLILQSNLKDARDQKIVRIGKLISSAASSPLVNYDFAQIECFATEIKKDAEIVDVIFKNQTGQRVNAENSKDSLTAAQAKFGQEKIQNASVSKFDFPINASGSQIGTMTIVAHNLEMRGSLFSLLLQIGLIFLLGIILLVVLTWISLTRMVIKPIQAMKLIANEIAVGNAGVKIEQDRDDEIGILQRSFSEIAASINQQALTAENMAMGNLEIKISVKSEHDVLSKSMIKVVDTLKQLVDETIALSSSAVNGNLSLRGKAEHFEGGYRQIVEGINDTLISVVKPIQECTSVLNVLSTGDLTARMKGDYQGELLLLKENVNKVAQSLNNVMLEVSEAVSSTAAAAAEISTSSEQLAAGSQEQSQQTTEIAYSVEQMTKTIYDSTENTAKAADNSKLASESAKEGARKVENTKNGMQRIVEFTKTTGERISSLTKRSDQIGEITQVIDDIADQTNLLALNAAIEAARAGEQGRGFAVVADEVRKLAERTTKATKEIADTIKKIQTEAIEADNSMNDASKAVEEGMLLTEEVSVSLSEILDKNQKVFDIVSQVAAASEEQSGAAEEINKNVVGISSVTQESAAGTAQIARSAEIMTRLTSNLQQLVGRFKLNSSDVSLTGNSGQATHNMRKQLY